MIAKTAGLDSGKWLIPRQTDTGKLEAERRAKARQTTELILDTFSEAELRELCLDFNLNYEDIPGQSRRERVVQLVDYFYRRRTLDVLIHWLSGKRPRTQWPATSIQNQAVPATEDKSNGLQ